MKRLLLVLAFLGLTVASASASATCTGPASMKDNASATFTMGLFQAGDGNCSSYVDITTWGGVNLTTSSSSTYGTAPTGTVPGVNAFVTNFPATQPVSVASGAVASGAYSAGAFAAGAGVDGWDLTQGTKADTPCTTPTSSTACSVIATLKAIANTGQYPAGATAVTASATGTTGATTATLTGVSAKTMYICSYSIRANATANTNVQNTITGLISGTRTDQMWVPANTAGLGVDEQIFTPCIPASATNTSIAVASGAPGSGGNVTVNAAGYYY
jgi:hypothetical protein